MAKEIQTVFEGDCWSTDDNINYTYELTITKPNAIRLVKLMDAHKALLLLAPEVKLHEISAWDNNVEIYEGDNEVICDVCKVRVESNGVLWELKSKYSTDIYETEDVMRSDIEIIANS